MHQLHLTILIFGVVFSSLLVAAYLWSRDKLTKDTWFSCIGFGVILGVVASASLFKSYFIYTVIMAGFVAYFVYLKDYTEYSFLKESTMCSLFLGALSGFFGLVGCIVCGA